MSVFSVKYCALIEKNRQNTAAMTLQIKFRELSLLLRFHIQARTGLNYDHNNQQQ